MKMRKKCSLFVVRNISNRITKTLGWERGRSDSNGGWARIGQNNENLKKRKKEKYVKKQNNRQQI